MQEERRGKSHRMIKRRRVRSSRVTYGSLQYCSSSSYNVNPILSTTYDYIMRDTHNFVRSGTSRRRGNARCYSTRVIPPPPLLPASTFMYTIHLIRTHLAGTVEKSQTNRARDRRKTGRSTRENVALRHARSSIIDTRDDFLGEINTRKRAYSSASTTTTTTTTTITMAPVIIIIIA